jgi:hypothetical protein
MTLSARALPRSSDITSHRRNEARYCRAAGADKTLLEIPLKHYPIYPTRHAGRAFGVVATAALLIVQSAAAWSLEPAINRPGQASATAAAWANEMAMPIGGNVLLAELEAIKQSVTIKPPLSKNGYRLFACLELDGDDCGKKDYREIASQFCAKEGYGEAKYKVETRKVKAETLEGGNTAAKRSARCSTRSPAMCR